MALTKQWLGGYAQNCCLDDEGSSTDIKCSNVLFSAKQVLPSFTLFSAVIMILAIPPYLIDAISVSDRRYTCTIVERSIFKHGRCQGDHTRATKTADRGSRIPDIPRPFNCVADFRVEQEVELCIRGEDVESNLDFMRRSLNISSFTVNVNNFDKWYTGHV